MVVSGNDEGKINIFLSEPFILSPSSLHIGVIYTSSLHIYAAISSKRFHLSRSSLSFFFSEMFLSVVHIREAISVRRTNSIALDIHFPRLNGEKKKRKDVDCRLFLIYAEKCATFDNDRRQWWK